MTMLERKTRELREAVRAARADLADVSVPVKRRVAEADEALEALGSLSCSLLGTVALLERTQRVRVRREPRMPGRLAPLRVQ